MVTFEDASFSNFREFSKITFSHGEVGDGGDGLNTICSRPEAADDVISGTDVKCKHLPVLRLYELVVCYL